MYVRLHPPGMPGWWADAATGERGDLLELLRRQHGDAGMAPATVALSTNPGAPPGQAQATPGTDYDTITTTTVVFLKSDFSAEGGVYVARKTVSITVHDDSHIEGTEYFELLLLRSVGLLPSVVLCTQVDCPVYAAIKVARRVVSGENARWELEVAPSGDDAVVLTLGASPGCGEAHALCTEDGRRLEESFSVTVPGPEAEEEVVVVEPLVGFFADAPFEHDGESAFTVQLGFSARITANKRKFPQAFDVTGGEITRAGGVDGRKDLWSLKVKPAGVASPEGLYPELR